MNAGSVIASHWQATSTPARPNHPLARHAARPRPGHRTAGAASSDQHPARRPRQPKTAASSQGGALVRAYPQQSDALATTQDSSARRGGRITPTPAPIPRPCRWKDRRSIRRLAFAPGVAVRDRLVVRAAPPGCCCSRAGPPPAGMPLPGGARDVGGDDVGGVPVEAATGPSAARNTGRSVRSATARSIARAVRGASGMVATLPPLRVMVSVRCPRSRPRWSMSALTDSETRSPFRASRETSACSCSSPAVTCSVRR